MRKPRVVSFAVALAAACAAGPSAVAVADTPSAGARALPAAGAGGSPTFASGAGADEVAGEIAVDVRDDADGAEIARLASAYGIVLRPNSRWSATHDRMEVADVDPAREASLIDALGRDPRVEHAEPMALYHETFVPDDPLYATKQWHLERVGAERAWNYTCGRGVTVAVVDTGIACFDKGPFSRGTDLAGTRCQGGYDFVDDSVEAADDQGHGTHVAGTIAQTTNNGVGAAGLAFCATLMPVKVLNKHGFGTVANVAEGIRFAADNGAQVVNLSLGGPMKSRILEDAVEHAIERGVVVVAAAGNTGRRVGWPAAYPGVLAVSATDAADSIAPFSSRGPEVAIAAPGVAVTQQTVCNGGRDRCEIFGTFSGTSMASPHVAGAAAMIESLGVTRGSAVRAELLASARPNGDAGLYGAGILDVGRAAASVFWGHLARRLFWLGALGGLLVWRIRKRRARVATGAGAVAGALVASVGILPIAPLFGLGAYAGRGATLVQLAMRPIGEWDIPLWGAGSHRWLLLASALPALGLAALGFKHRLLRPLIGGVALGTAAFLAQTIGSADAVFAGGLWLSRGWAAASALVCLWIARAGLER